MAPARTPSPVRLVLGLGLRQVLVAWPMAAELAPEGRLLPRCARCALDPLRAGAGNRIPFSLVTPTTTNCTGGLVSPLGLMAEAYFTLNGVYELTPPRRLHLNQASASMPTLGPTLGQGSRV